MNNSLLLTKLAGAYSSSLERVLANGSNEIKLLNVAIAGAYPMELLFVMGGVDSLDAHPRFGDLLTGATTRGQDWMQGLLSAPTMSIASYRGQSFVGSVEHNSVVANSSATGWTSQARRDVVFSLRQINLENLHSTLITALDAQIAATPLTAQFQQWLVNDRPILQAVDAELRTLLDGFGYATLSDVTSRVVHIDANVFATAPPAAPQSIQWKADTWPWTNNDAVDITTFQRCGVDYAQIIVSANSNVSSAPATYTFYWTVPIQRQKHGRIPMMVTYKASAGTAVATFFREYAGPLMDTYSLKFPLSKASFFDVPDAYKTDLFGKVWGPTDLVQTWSLPATSVAKKELLGAAKIKLMPLLVPPGEAFFLARGLFGELEEAVETVTIDDLDGPREITIKTTSVTLNAERLYSAIPQGWYESYYANGYGVFKGKGAEAAAAKVEAMVSLSGITHTAVFYDGAMPIPTDLVTRTTTYLEYKKAKEKACETNDFMDLKYDGVQTWGQVNKLCNQAGPMHVTFGYRDTAPTVSMPFEPVTAYAYRADTAFSPFRLFVTISGGLEVAVAEKDPEAVGRIAAGASLTGTTLAALRTSWGMTDQATTDVLGEMSSTGASWQSSVDPAFRGSEYAEHDYSWESSAISGFGDLRRLRAQDGFRAVIISLATVAGRTAKLHEAYLRFGNRSRIHALL